MIETSKPILVTGAAGFIGFHLSKRLLDEGYEVVGLDNLNDYYDPNLKKSRLSNLNSYENFTFLNKDLADQELKSDFKEHEFEFVINLAAQAGVRYSLINPFAYTNTNITGFVNLLECCKELGVRHVIYASSSSVYGANERMPFRVTDTVDHPISLYAATKKANELIAHSYASNFNLPVTGLRFFTVYGPWGRPDMALFLFTKKILEGKPISVYNHGNMKRDFTYIDDIVESIYRLIPKIAHPDNDWDSKSPQSDKSFAPYRIFNVGNNSPVKLMDFVRAIEKSISREANISYEPIQKGDVQSTYADTSQLINVIGYKPNTPIEIGVQNFVNWYKNYYEK
ncbi:MAG: NAD-dependent epimerase [Cyclobacteriaceae bacterium]